MTKKQKIDKWLEDNYEWFVGEIEANICKGLMSQYSGDLAIHIIEDLYKLPEEKIDQMLRDEKLGWYCLVGAGRQLRSSTSPFYRTYRHQKSWAREDGLKGTTFNIFDRAVEEYNEDLYQCFLQAYDDLHFYQKALIDKYFYENMSLQSIHQYYGISKIHLVNDLKQTINIIRNKCQEC